MALKLLAGTGQSEKEKNGETAYLYHAVHCSGENIRFNCAPNCNSNIFKLTKFKTSVWIRSGPLIDIPCLYIFLNDGWLCVNRTFRQARIEQTIYQRFGERLLLS